ncbi:MAG: hypothetical protein ACTHJ1_11155 [Bordetella sp.]|uniref:hypothetical protein n=1 Tax=Bordetella sp. TaxID=28081 RepID=UPI003F7B9D29
MASDELERDRMLDALLDTLDCPDVSAGLRARIIATIPPGRRSLVRQHPWWSGLGLIGAATTGVAAGTLCMSLLMTPFSNSATPGSPDGALSFRESAFVLPTTAMQEED